MTRTEAKRYVCAMACNELESHIANGSEWLNPDGASEADLKRIEEALQELTTELFRRGQRSRP
jgi:hypothetical protein